MILEELSNEMHGIIFVATICKIFEGPGDEYCNVLTLARCLMATKLLCHSPPHLVNGENTSQKACMGEIITGRNYSLLTVLGKRDFTWGN